MDYFGNIPSKVISIRCPSCRRIGIFHGVNNISDANFGKTKYVGERRVSQYHHYGLRVCPNPDCREPLFVVISSEGKLSQSYPVECLEFEPQNVPEKVVKSLEEAITCHANGCFRACAIMVRRTLEEICADRGASGGDLKQRIASLGTKILVPKDLLDAADELRLLGNDAAHLEAKVYDSVGKEEVEAAIDLTKEILKAVYQLSSLVGRLRALKKV